jgi:transcriptional regulator with XRE-family HTH domain
MDDFKDRIGKLIKEEKSRNAFSKKCGISDTLIGKYAKGKSQPGLKKLKKIAERSGVSIAWLAEGKGEMRSVSDYQDIDKNKLKVGEKHELYGFSPIGRLSPGEKHLLTIFVDVINGPRTPARAKFMDEINESFMRFFNSSVEESRANTSDEEKTG